MISSIDVVVFLGGIGVTILVVALVRRGKLHEAYAFVWLAVGPGLIVVSLWPDAFGLLDAWVGVNRQLGILLIFGATLAFVLALQYAIALSRLEDQDRRLAQAVALLRHNLECRLHETVRGGAGPDQEQVEQTAEAREA